MSMTEEELLKKIAELEKENKRLKERQSFRASIRREDAYEAVKNLLKRDMQNYQVLAEKMNISDRTLRMFAVGDSDDTTDKTLGILGNYFTEEFKSSYKDLALYRAYTNAKKPEEREQLYDRLNSLFDDFLIEFDKIYDKKIYSIKEKGIVATGEFVDGGFLVHKGSEGVRDYVKSVNGEVFERRRNELIEEGVIERVGDKIVFLQDYKFNSPSGAARMIIGSFANGRIRRRSEGVALKDLEPELYEQERMINRPINTFISRMSDSEREIKVQDKPVSLAFTYPLNGKRKITCTFKKPNGIFIDGVFYEDINDWIKVIPLIGKKLFEKNPVFFERMVDQKVIVKDKGDLIITDHKIDDNWTNIEGTDYYVERCFSSNDVRKYAGRLVKYWNDNSGSKIDVKVRIKKTRF